MKRLLGGIFLAVLIGVPAYAALKAGGAAPDFSAKASLAGKEFDYSLKAALAKGPVVVYFYPSAFTGGCNIEAHTFAETKEKFDAAGATIIGVSRDSIARLNAFSADPQYCAGKIPVASDADASNGRTANVIRRSWLEYGATIGGDNNPRVAVHTPTPNRIGIPSANNNPARRGRQRSNS